MSVSVSTHQSDLEELLTDWSEERSVGDVILKYVSLDDGRFFVRHMSVFPQLKRHLSTSWKLGITYVIRSCDICPVTVIFAK